MSDLDYFMQRNDAEQKKILEILFMIETNGVRPPDSISVDDGTGEIQMSWNASPLVPILRVTYSDDDKDYGFFTCEDWSVPDSEMMSTSFCLDDDDEVWQQIASLLPI